MRDEERGGRRHKAQNKHFLQRIKNDFLLLTKPYLVDIHPDLRETYIVALIGITSVRQGEFNKYNTICFRVETSKKKKHSYIY